MIKGIRILTFFALISTNALSQSITNDYDNCIDSLIFELNNLPKTFEWGLPNNKNQSKYTVKTKKKKTILVVYDNRYEPNSMVEKADRYKTIVNFSDLHPEGIVFKYNSDTTTISLMLFTAENRYSVKTKNYIENSLHSKDYKDRIHFGAWNTRSIYKQLNKIADLFKICIEYKSNWTSAEKPDVHQIVSFNNIKNKSDSILSLKDQTILNASLENPTLFMNAKSVDENNEVVKQYIIEKLNSQGFKIKRDIIGEIIISSKGEVLDFKALNKIDIRLKEALKEIILSMPKWTPAIYKQSNFNVSQYFMISK